MLLVSLAPSASARAANREEKERAAKKACLSGDYTTGVSLLADLYVDTNDANYIFNQGRCYEQCNRCEDAIVSFREYLRKIKDAGRVSDGRAEQHITDCEELLAKIRRQEAVAGDAPTPGPSPTHTVGQTESGPGPVVARSLPSPSSGRGLRIAGVVTFGIGVAAIGAGVGFALAANGLASELEQSPSSYERSKESTRTGYATVSTIGYAAGAACVVGGAVLYYLGVRQRRAASAAVQPMVSAQTAGALVRVEF